jgi:hypothetical protein
VAFGFVFLSFITDTTVALYPACSIYGPAVVTLRITHRPRGVSFVLLPKILPSI